MFASARIYSCKWTTIVKLSVLKYQKNDLLRSLGEFYIPDAFLYIRADLANNYRMDQLLGRAKLAFVLVFSIFLLINENVQAAVFLDIPAEDFGADIREVENIAPVYLQYVNELYQRMGLEQRGLKKSTFDKGFKGYLSMKSQQYTGSNPILTIVDFDQASTEERLYVLNMDQGVLLYQTLVSHGKNTGTNIAKSFSNRHASYKSSLGFALTAETYVGRNGYSLRLDGLERGWNSEMRPRAVVMHGAPYVSHDFVRQHGRLGRSHGCPALPQELNREILDLIKGGSCIYQHKNDSKYLNTSKMLDQSKAFNNFRKFMDHNS